SSRAAGFCRARFGIGYDARLGDRSGFAFPLQRLGVSPDGSSVVFEVNDEFSVAGLTVAPEQEGMFIVRSDGRDLRHLGPPSQEKSFEFAVSPPIPFTPNGRRIPSPDRR